MKILNTKGGSVLRMSIVAALFAMGSGAYASGISGTIAFNGYDLIVKDASNNILSNHLANAATINLGTSGLYVSPGAGSVSGDYATGGVIPSVLPFGPFNIASPHNIIPVGTQTFASTNVFSITGYNPTNTAYTFAATSEVSSYSVGTGALSINLYGTVSDGNPADDTIAKFLLSIPQTGSPSSSGIVYSANFYSPATLPTPLPAALFFVAPALAGVFGFSRRKNGSKLAA